MIKQASFDLINSDVISHNIPELGMNVPTDIEILTADQETWCLSLAYRGQISDLIGMSVHESQTDFHLLGVEPDMNTRGFFFFMELENAPIFYDLNSLAQAIIDELIKRDDSNQQQLREIS